MRATTRIFAGCLAVLLGACVGGDRLGGGSFRDGKADGWGEVGSGSHRGALLECERIQQVELDRAMSTAEIAGALDSYRRCLFEINNEARDVIEQNLADIESFAYGTSGQSFADFRWAAELLCSVAVDWSDGADGTMSQLVRASCLAEGERALADLIDAYVYFGGEQEQLSIPEDRVTFATCYAQQDAALETAVANNEILQPLHDAADCIEGEIDGRVAGLAESTVATFPERTLAEVEATIRESIRRMSVLNGEMCSLVAEASDAGGGTIASLYHADCRSDAAELMYRFAGIGVVAADPTDAIREMLERGHLPPVHPELGVHVVDNPGAIALVLHYQSFAEMLAGVPGAEQVFDYGTCTPQDGPVSFSCEEEAFGGEGCFLEPTRGASPITTLYGMLAEYDLYTATDAELAAAAAAESHIAHYVVVTATRIGLYFGTVDGEVWLLAADLSRYSCSA